MGWYRSAKDENWTGHDSVVSSSGIALTEGVGYEHVAKFKPGMVVIQHSCSASCPRWITGSGQKVGRSAQTIAVLSLLRLANDSRRIFQDERAAILRFPAT